MEPSKCPVRIFFRWVRNCRLSKRTSSHPGFLSWYGGGCGRSLKMQNVILLTGIQKEGGIQIYIYILYTYVMLYIYVCIYAHIYRIHIYIFICIMYTICFLYDYICICRYWVAVELMVVTFDDHPSLLNIESRHRCQWVADKPTSAARIDIK